MTENRKKAGVFEKGKSGNPKGRKPLPKDVKAARSMAYVDLIRTAAEVRLMSFDDAKREAKSKTTPLGRRAIINAYLKNDYRGIKDFEDRLFGKAQESIQLTGADGAPLIPQAVVFKVVDAHDSRGGDCETVPGDS